MHTSLIWRYLLNKEEIFKRANNGDISILKIDNIHKCCDDKLNSVLHILAKLGKIEILKNQFVGVVKNICMDTPLHTLVQNDECIESILSHRNVSTCKNEDSNTPLHLIGIRLAKMPDSDLKIRCLDLFLKHKDISSVLNKFNKTPVDYFF